MPMYQYICRTCEHAFEKRLRMSQAGEAQTCPDCGGLKTRKRIGVIAVNGANTIRASEMSVPASASPFS